MIIQDQTNKTVVKFVSPRVQFGTNLALLLGFGAYPQLWMIHEIAKLSEWGSSLGPWLALSMLQLMLVTIAMLITSVCFNPEHLYQLRVNDDETKIYPLVSPMKSFSRKESVLVMETFYTDEINKNGRGLVVPSKNKLGKPQVGDPTKAMYKVSQVATKDKKGLRLEQTITPQVAAVWDSNMNTIEELLTRPDGLEISA